MNRGGHFITHVRVTEPVDARRYPFTLPAVQYLAKAGGLDLGPGVTFFAGDNGTGKSTLIEAIAVAAGFNPEGGSRSFQFATRATESDLGDCVTLRWEGSKPRDGFFLRAESFYNVATEIERLDSDEYSPPLLPAYGGVSFHERSHGQAFLQLASVRFRSRGLYLMDEPEAALSPRGCLAMLSRISELADAGAQFIIATHSPILLAAPGAQILQLDESGRIEQVSYDEAETVSMMRGFLGAPEQFLRHL